MEEAKKFEGSRKSRLWMNGKREDGSWDLSKIKFKRRKLELK
jgi:hypothetical protein